MTDDNVPAVCTTFYLLLATGHFGFGALSNRLVDFVAVQNFKDCSGWNVCIFKSIDPAAGKGGSAVMSIKKIKKFHS